MIIVAISIISGILGTILYVTNNDIMHGILIIDRMPVGNNITLDYEIKNGMFAPSVSDVYLDIWVFHLNDTALDRGLLHYYIPIYLNRDGGIKASKTIGTHCLDSGEYIVWTDLIYTTDRAHYKQLAIEFEIY